MDKDRTLSRLLGRLDHRMWPLTCPGKVLERWWNSDSPLHLHYESQNCFDCKLLKLLQRMTMMNYKGNIPEETMTQLRLTRGQRSEFWISLLEMVQFNCSRLPGAAVICQGETTRTVMTLRWSLARKRRYQRTKIMNYKITIEHRARLKPLIWRHRRTWNYVTPCSIYHIQLDLPFVGHRFPDCKNRSSSFDCNSVPLK